MVKIKSNNVPIELFGHDISTKCPPDGIWKELKAETPDNPFKDIDCPYTNSKCDKIRKAAPNALIGNCTVRQTKAALNSHQDWMVCPKRFEQDNIIFKDCIKLIKGEQTDLKVTNEIQLKGAGNIDFALISKGENNELKDFLGIEVQGMGTSNSGGIWNARNDYLDGNLKDNYVFSLNQKDASKKILIQLLHKGAQLSRWRYSLVLVIQDYFLDHLREQYNIDTHFHKQDTQDFIHIHSYSYLKGENGKYTIKLKEAISTDMLGLSMCLISNPAREYLPLSSLEERIVTREKEGKLRDL